jgi:hypothetical protein
MSIDKLSPSLLKTDNASDNDVLTFVSANSRVEFKSASSGVTTGKAIAMAIVFG